MIRLGMIGTGRIAQRFVEAVEKVKELQLVCVYNPHCGSADRYVQSVWNEKPDKPIATDSWERLMEVVDAVYIASPHETHYEYAKRALGAEKHVLCEKPMVLCKKEVEELYDLAHKQSCVLLEAVKTAYCPGFLAMMKVAKSGVIGDICDVEACFTKLISTNMREYTDVAYGGSVTELGSYSLLPIMKLFGTNYEDVLFQSVYAPNGVDKFTKVCFTYPNGMAMAKTGIGVKSEGELIISGTRGYIYCQAPWWLTRRFEVRYEDPDKHDLYEFEYEGGGLQYELDFFAKKILGQHVDADAGVTRDESVMAAGMMEKFLERNENRRRRNEDVSDENQIDWTIENRDKVKVAIWGITDDIWNSVRNTLNPEKVDIVFFIDNNPQRWGSNYGKSPVYQFNDEALEKLQAIDYVLIAAYSGYQAIRKQLIDHAYPESQIQLYITDSIGAYELGELQPDEGLIKKIYFAPERMIQRVEHYHEMCYKYEHINRLPDCFDRWYGQESLISHACGGFVNGRKVMYTNSAEALDYSLKAGFKLIECDVMRDEQGRTILAHGKEELYNAMYEGCTIQTLEMMLKKIREYLNVHMLIDVKWDDEYDYQKYIEEICDTIKKIADSESEVQQLKHRIVMEAYNEITIRLAKSAGFDIFYIQYRNLNVFDYKDTAILCEKYGVGVVGFPCKYILANKQLVNIFRKKNIQIFGFSTDSLQEYTQLKQMGVQGIFTNYLSVQDGMENQMVEV